MALIQPTTTTTRGKATHYTATLASVDDYVELVVPNIEKIGIMTGAGVSIGDIELRAELDPVGTDWVTIKNEAEDSVMIESGKIIEQDLSVYYKIRIYKVAGASSTIKYGIMQTR